MRRATLALLLAAAVVIPAVPASAVGRSPRLERFVARYNPSSTTTFYIAVAGDPDGGKLEYQWSLKAECGFLTDPEATGPSQGYQHGPPAQRPDGCTSEQDRKATITLRIVDPEGCAIVYTQQARDETEHIAPATRAEPCPPEAKQGGDAAAESTFPVVPILVAGVLALLVFTVVRVRGRGRLAPDAPPWAASEPDAGAPAAEADAPAPRTLEPAFEQALVPEPDPAPEPEPAPRRRAVPLEEPEQWYEPESQPRPRRESMLARMKRSLAAMTASEEFDDHEPGELMLDPEPEQPEPVAPRAAAPPPRTGEPVLPTIRSYDSLAADVPSFMGDTDLDEAEPEPAEQLQPSFSRTPPIEGDAADDDAALERILGAATGDEPCREGAIRQNDSDFVAHETLLAGTVRARALRSGNTVDIPPDDPAEILRLAAGMSDDAPLEVEVAVPVRLVTVVSSRREVCRGGVWVPDVASTTHDGPERVERLRAIVTTPDELERFARDILAKRLRSLTGARRRLESALAAMRGRI